MEDRLVIGYDKTVDHSALVVGRKNGRGLTIINQFHDIEAEEIYKKLIMPKKDTN